MATPKTVPTRNPGGKVPLNIWPCAQTSAQWQRQGRYVKESFEHPGKMLPALAQRIIETYSKPGDLIVDPMCGIGTTLVEAAALGRRCIGVDLEDRWVAVAKKNVAELLTAKEAGMASVRMGDARHLTAVLSGVAGSVDLIATSPPYACEVGRVDKDAWARGDVLCDPRSLNYSADRANLGHLRSAAYRDAMREVYQACFDALRPGGLLVTVTKNMHQGGRLVHLAGTTSATAQSVGFGYLQHNVALLGGLEGTALKARPSFWQQSHLRRARSRGQCRHLVVHEDVLVFLKPEGRA